MSRSTQDLIEVLRRDAQTPVDPTAVWLGAVRLAKLRRARRRLLATIGTAVTVVLAVSLPLTVFRANPAGHLGAATPSSPGTVTPAPTSTAWQSRPILTWTLRASTVGPWRIVPATTGEWSQRAYVYRSDKIKTTSTVDVYEPGAFDPAPLLGGVRTTVRGVAAFYAVVADPLSDGGPAEPTIAWEYAPKAWAVVHGWFGEPPQVAAPTDGTVPATLRRVAEAVVVGEPTPARIPFKMGYLPPGLHPVTAGVYDQERLAGGVAFDRDGDPHDWRDPFRYRWLPLAVSLTEAIPRQWQPDTTLAGVPAMRNGNAVIIQRDGYWLTIGAGDLAAPLAQSELERVFMGLTLADRADPNTWFDASAAVGSG